MEALGIYLLKASAILTLFYLTYRFLLRRETLFGMNRIFLFSGLLAAGLLPLVRITNTVALPAPQQVILTSTALPDTGTVAVSGAFPWETLLLAGYGLGVLACILGVLRQLGYLSRLVRTGTRNPRDGFVYVSNTDIQAPFSFFRYIFYNPEFHEAEELGIILEHERAHGRQLHTLDILMGRLVGALLWMNPVGRWYQQSIEQNLEYLADSHAVRQIPSVRDYQYTLLRVSGNSPVPGLANAFYSSLIKKRILMLHQNQSKNIQSLKHLLVVPALGLFLMAFNTETVYVPQDGPSNYIEVADDQTVELTISKDTSNDELLKIKEKLAADGIDFSYTAVRNADGEIIDLEIGMSGKNSKGKTFSGTYQTDSDGPIDPVRVRFDDESNSLSFGNAKNVFFGKRSGTVTIHSTADHDEKDGKHSTVEIRSMDGDDSDDSFYWISGGDEDAEVIEIREVKGNKVIIVDGEEIDEKEYEKRHKAGDKIQKIHVSRTLKSDGNHVMILRDSDDEADIEVISGDADGFFFIDSGKGEKPLYFIDDKKASEKEVKALDPKTIDKIEVLKGEKATEEYGKKAKDGVVRITTKD